MSATESITRAITNFVKGGDERNLEKLDRVLHPDFRITNSGFMGSKGVTVIDKQQYLSNIKEGVFGGLPRTMKIEHIEEFKTIAMAKLHLESSENSFISFNSLVLDLDNEWKLINNLAIVEAKK